MLALRSVHGSTKVSRKTFHMGSLFLSADGDSRILEGDDAGEHAAAITVSAFLAGGAVTEGGGTNATTARPQ